MSWKMIKNQQDADELNELFGNFCNSCLKEMCFSSGGFVTHQLSMNVVSTPVARFLFQRQASEHTVIELEFGDVLQINIKPPSGKRGVDIVCAHLYYEDGVFFWSEKDRRYHEKRATSTWIAARSVWWRERPDTLGEDAVYMADGR